MTPPAFDVLYWNNDTTRLPARLHADFLDLIDTNPYVNPGRLDVRGKPLDMRQVDIDSYVVAGLTDHITPWQGCYNTAKLYGERSTFVLVQQRPYPEPAQSAGQSARRSSGPAPAQAASAGRVARAGGKSTRAAGGRTGSNGSRRVRTRCRRAGHAWKRG